MSTKVDGTANVNLAELLRASYDESWPVRKAAIDDLASFISDPRVFSRLVEALEDEDLGIIESATDALAVHGGKAGLREIARVYSQTHDNGVYSLSERLAASSYDHGVPVRARFAEILAEHPSAEVRQGITELLEELPADQRNDAKPSASHVSPI